MCLHHVFFIFRNVQGLIKVIGQLLQMQADQQDTNKPFTCPYSIRSVVFSHLQYYVYYFHYFITTEKLHNEYEKHYRSALP